MDSFKFDDEAFEDNDFYMGFDEDEDFSDNDFEDYTGEDELSDNEEFEDNINNIEQQEDNNESTESDNIDTSGFEVSTTDNDFISETGDFVVMDNTDSADNFRIVYVPIEKIAVSKRIRDSKNVESLMRSIKSTGLLNPIVVAPTITEDMYVLLHGYRRILACARLGKKNIPCVVNNKVSTPEVPILEALYNHGKSYSIKEQVNYIEYLEKEKGILNPNMIEYLLQMNNGDYTKLKDILNDNDEDIVDKLYSGVYTIEAAFKKLEQRRKKESAEEKELQRADKVYGDEEGSGADEIAGSGEEIGDEPELTPEEIQELAIGVDDLDSGLEEQSLEEMIEEGKEIKGFETHKQDVKDREILDPVIRKSVLVRDKYTCQCCLEGGESYIDVLEAHHIIPVFLNKGVSADVGGDNIENLVTLCLKCHRQVHLYSTNELYIPKAKTDEELEKMNNEERIVYNNERNKFKRIVKLGTVIRRGMEVKGIKLQQYRKEHPSRQVGHKMPSYRNSNVSIEEVRNASND